MKLFYNFFNKQEKKITIDDLVKNILIVCPFLESIDSNERDNLLVSVIEDIKKICTMIGSSIENAKIIRTGQDACVLECKGKIIKITRIIYDNKLLSEYVSRSDSIIKPLFEKINVVKYHDINMFVTVHMFDKLDTKNITIYDTEQMYIQLREDGYIWSDPRPENLGRDETGKIKLIDYGQIVYINDKDEYYKRKEIEANENMYPNFANAYREYISYNQGIKNR